MTRDDHLKPESTREGLAKLQPAFGPESRGLPGWLGDPINAGANGCLRRLASQAWWWT